MPRGKVKDPNMPRARTSAYAFFLRACREELNKSHPEETAVNFGDFNKHCGSRWKTLPESVKAEFQELAVRDKARFQLEMQAYVPPSPGEGVATRRRYRKRGSGSRKDPAAPKRPLTAFILFCNEERAKVMAANPAHRVSEVAKELGRMWKLLGPEAKRPYHELAAQDRDRYKREMTEQANRRLREREMEMEQGQDDDEDEDEGEEEEDQE